MKYDVTYCCQPCGNKLCGLRVPDDGRPVRLADFGSDKSVCLGFEPLPPTVDNSSKS